MPTDQLLFTYQASPQLVIEKYQTIMQLNALGHIVLPFTGILRGVSFEPVCDYEVFVNGEYVASSETIGGQSHFNLNDVPSEQCCFIVGTGEVPTEVHVLINESCDVVVRPYQLYELNIEDEGIYTESIEVLSTSQNSLLFRMYNRAWGILTSNGEVSFERFNDECDENIYSDQDKVIVDGQCTVRLAMYGKTYIELTHAISGPLDLLHTYYLIHHL